MGANSNIRKDKWAIMMSISFLFHIAVFSTVFFVPQSTSLYPSVKGKVCYVELVGPLQKKKKETKATAVNKGKKRSRALKTETRRVIGKRKKTTRIVAKRVSPLAKKTKVKDFSTSELIDRAISRVETKPVKEEKREVVQYQEYLEKDGVGAPEVKSGENVRVSPLIGKIIQIYKLEMERAIKENWAYPVSLLNLKEENMPEAIIILVVRSDGKIMKTRFKKRSNNHLFDGSVLKAIEKADPLPKFPPGYRKSSDEVEINFSLKDFI